MTDIPLTAFGEVLTGKIVPMTAWRFDYGINTRVVKSTTANGGSVSADGNRAKLATSAAVNGSARIETLKRLRYFPGMGGLLRMTSVFSTPKASSYQLFGLGDGTDGLYYGFYGTDFVVGKIRGGVHTRVLQSEWNGSPMTTWNRTNATDAQAWATADNPFYRGFGNVFQIRFQWLGYGYLRFYMLDYTNENGGYIPLHTINYPNTSPDVHILNPTLPIFGEVANIGNNTDIVAYSPSAAAFTEGESGEFSNPLDIFNSFDITATLANTSNNHLLTIRNKATFASVTNRVPVQINTITISRSSGATQSTIKIYRNATTAGALTYVDLDTSNSPVDTSVTTTTITSTSAERAYSTQAGMMEPIEFKPGELVLNPGDSIAIGVVNSGVQSTDFVVTVNWSEQF